MFRILILLSLTPLTIFAHDLPHFDLEMSVEEMQNQIKQNKFKGEDARPIKQAIKRGERLADWLKFENDRRSEAQQLRLTNPQLRRGIPIDKPSIYSDRTVDQEMTDLWKELPIWMKEVFEGGKFPAAFPVSDEDFLAHARKLNRIYETAVRFKMMEPYRFALSLAKHKDVRGYYYLNQNKWNQDRLRQEFSIQTSDVQKQIKEALVNICVNSSKDEKACSRKVDRAGDGDLLAEIYADSIKAAEKNWLSFFEIPRMGRRRDIVWSVKNPEVATIPFITPESDKIKNYIKDNVEEEWSWKGWNLKIIFGQYTSAPHVRFQAGVTPNVNGLGGNTITMDANQPVEEYGSRWTIRHEFGHVLGFPDCYHEFYDSKLEAYVNYQLDTTDLMCSRAGDMNERLFDEMKKNYFN